MWPLRPRPVYTSTGLNQSTSSEVFRFRYVVLRAMQHARRTFVEEHEPYGGRTFVDLEGMPREDYPLEDNAVRVDVEHSTGGNEMLPTLGIASKD